jgi:hypothetical protein
LIYYICNTYIARNTRKNYFIEKTSAEPRKSSAKRGTKKEFCKKEANKSRNAVIKIKQKCRLIKSFAIIRYYRQAIV